MNVTEREVFRLIHEHGGVLVRHKKHQVYRFSDGRIVTLASSPSRPWADRALCHLRRFLAAAPPVSAGSAVSVPAPALDLIKNAEPVERKRLVRKEDRPKQVQVPRVESPAPAPPPVSTFQPPTYSDWERMHASLVAAKPTGPKSDIREDAKFLVMLAKKHAPEAGVVFLWFLNKDHATVLPLRGSTFDQIRATQVLLSKGEHGFGNFYTLEDGIHGGIFAPKSFVSENPLAERLLYWLGDRGEDFVYEKKPVRFDLPLRVEMVRTEPTTAR